MKAIVEIEFKDLPVERIQQILIELMTEKFKYSRLR